MLKSHIERINRINSDLNDSSLFSCLRRKKKLSLISSIGYPENRSLVGVDCTFQNLSDMHSFFLEITGFGVILRCN